MIIPTTATTASTPTHTPALKIPPITSQPLKVSIIANNENVNAAFMVLILGE